MLIVLVPILSFCVYRNRRAASNHSALFGNPTTISETRTVCQLQAELADLQTRVAILSNLANCAARSSQENTRDIRHMQSVRPKRSAAAARGPLVAAQFNSDAGGAGASSDGTATVKLLPLTYDNSSRPPSYNDSGKPHS